MLGTSVFPHVTLLSEASAAYVARVRLLPGVYLDVVVQGLRSGEGLLAVMTLVSAIATVYQSVLVKHGPGQEGLVAHVALERPLPRMLLPNVIRQVRLYRETLIAIFASVGLDAHVESLVSPHVTGLRVTLAANVADVRPQSVVPPFVRIQRVRRGQQAAANVAGKLRTLISPVILYVLTFVEHAAAELADELRVARLG